MYSIFGTKTKPKQYLAEDEPPPKRIVTDADALIKELSRKQLQKKTSLAVELNTCKEFERAEQYNSFSKFNCGTNSLCSFQSSLKEIENDAELSVKGLSENDIKMFKDYKNLDKCSFFKKYHNIEKSILRQRLQSIERQTQNHTAAISTTKSLSKHNQEYLSSVKPDSVETRLLKFALENETQREKLPHPMDQLQEIESEIKQNAETVSNCDIKKIRKKARSLQSQIESLKNTTVVSNPLVKISTSGKSMWDIKKETPPKMPTVTLKQKEKVFSCDKQTFYTIKDNKIVKLSTPSENNETQVKIQGKLTVEEIKEIPKFFNYHPGDPATILFLKNLSKHVSEIFLRNHLRNFSQCIVSIKMMTGKMKGQAFVEFTEQQKALEALQVLNGLVVDKKPIIVQFGRAQPKQ